MTPPRFEIHQADALNWLRSAEPGQVDAMVLDPPYASGGFTESARRTAAKKLRGSAWIEGDHMGTPALVWTMRNLAVDAYRILPTGASLVVFCDWRQLDTIAAPMESSGMRRTNTVVWDKGDIGPGKGFRSTHELMLHFTKGPGRYYAKDVPNVLRVKRVYGAHKTHPNEKPVALLENIIRLVCPPGGTVLDPYAGSGSTGVAALQLGRRFIGVERNATFAQQARKRLAAVAMADG